MTFIDSVKFLYSTANPISNSWYFKIGPIVLYSVTPMVNNISDFPTLEIDYEGDRL